MEELLIDMYIRRRVSWEDIKDLLPKLDGQLWLLGKQGSRRLVEKVSQYNPEQWRKACEGGYVYVEHAHQWAFAPEMDPQTYLPVLMVPYAEAFKRPALETATPAAPVQLEMNTNPATEAVATTHGS